MSRFGLVGPTYQSQSPLASADFCMNWYPEIIETGMGKSQVTLYPTPGLSVFATLPGPSVPAMYQINGRLFAKSGPNLIEPLSNGGFNTWGAILDDGLPASFASSPQQLLIASAGAAYVFNLQTNTLTQIPPATFPGPVSLVSFIDGFFLALIAGSQQIFASALLDATTWPPLSTTIVSVFPDNLLSMIATHRELVLFGLKSTVVYDDTGNFPFPFDVNPSGFIEQGTIARFSPVRLDNSVFWLGGDERGAPIAWRAQGYSPIRVSTHAVEFVWQGYAVVSDAISYSYQDQGHTFWVIFFPSANATWVYDAATNMWHQRGFWNINKAAFDAHHSQCHAFIFGKHLVGDWSSGNLYQMAIPFQTGGTWNFAADAGKDIRRVRRAPHISTEDQWIFHSQLQVSVETGLGPQPPLQGSTVGTQVPLSLTLRDSNNVLWTITVNTAGNLISSAGSVNPAQTLVLNDSATGTTSWQIGITIGGLLTTASVAFNPANPQTYALTDGGPSIAFNLVVTQAGLLQTQQQFEYLARGPFLNLRWSDDGGHSWSNEYARDCGQAGNFRTRVIWRRLGRSRDRVYEINCSDQIGWRIIDAYLQAAPGYEPQERFSKNLAKVA